MKIKLFLFFSISKCVPTYTRQDQLLDLIILDYQIPLPGNSAFSSCQEASCSTHIIAKMFSLLMCRTLNIKSMLYKGALYIYMQTFVQMVNQSYMVYINKVNTLILVLDIFNIINILSFFNLLFKERLSGSSFTQLFLY